MAAPAIAQDAVLVLDGKPFAVPAPGGFCSKGAAVDSYIANQRLTGRRVPEAVFMKCGAAAEEYDGFTLATLPRRKSLADFLEMYRRGLPSVAGQNLMQPESQAALAARLSAALNSSAEVKAQMQLVSVDDVCGYMVGAFHVVLDGVAHDTTVTSCATIVDGQEVVLFRYLARKLGANEALTTLPALRALALSIHAAP
jgi:hypothetical protein